MIEAINRRVQHEGVSNVRTVLGHAGRSATAVGGLDAVLIVDAYHEMDDPARPDLVRTLLSHVAASLKPQGRIGVVDFMPGGGGPGPAAEDRVSQDSVIRAAEDAGLKLQSRDAVPPFQFLLVFGKVPVVTAVPPRAVSHP